MHSASAKHDPTQRSAKPSLEVERELIDAEIVVPAAPQPASFTGERYVSSEGGIIRAEHYHRYLFARSLCADRDVLDVASGEGYGAALLGQVARSVIGVEVEKEAVARAKAAYPSPTVEFRQGLAQNLPLDDKSVDVVVSFETLEHFAEQEEFLSECRRVLRPDGMLVISTPDRRVYSPPGAPPNSFHVKELDREEFTALLEHHFPHVQIIVQTPVIGSLIVSGEGAISAREFYDEAGTRQDFSQGPTPRRPMYLIGIAGPRPLPEMASVLNLYPSAEADRAGYAQEMARLARSEREYRAALEERDATISRMTPFEAETVRLNSEVALRDAEINRLIGLEAHYRALMTERESEIARLSAELAVASSARAAIEERFRASLADAAELSVARVRERTLSSALTVALDDRWRSESRNRDLDGEIERLSATVSGFSAEVDRLNLENSQARDLAESSTARARAAEALCDEAARTRDTALADLERVQRQAVEVVQLRSELITASSKIGRLERLAAEAETAKLRAEREAIEARRAHTANEQLRAELGVAREDGVRQKQERASQVGRLSSELQAIQVARHQILSSTTWKLARALASAGRFLPAPVRSGARVGLRAAARAVRSRPSAAPPDADTDPRCPSTASSSATFDTSSATSVTQRPAFSLRTSAFTPPNELERFDLIIPCEAEGGLDPALRLELEALAGSGVRVVLTGRRPPSAGACHRVPSTGGDPVADLDRLIRACTSPNVIVASDLSQIDLGSLHRLSRTFTERPSIAAACGLVLDQTGAVAASGALLSGNALHPHATGEDPEDFALASVVERPQLWPALIAFDSDVYLGLGGLRHGATWATALTDFCLRAHQRGFSVVCNPLVKAVASGPTTDFPVELASVTVCAPPAAAEPAQVRKVLFTDGITPTPDKDSGSQDIYWLMRIFVDWGWSVTFLPTGDLRRAGGYTDDLRQLGILCPIAPAFRAPWEFIREHAADVDLAIAHRVTSACHVIEPLRQWAPQAKVVFDTVDLHHLREKRMATASGDAREMANALLTEEAERNLMRRSDATILLSRYEYDLVGDLEPGVQRFLLPIVRDVPGRTRGVEGRQGAVFVGGFSHTPNIDAALHLCRDLWPSVRELRPNAQVWIVGSNPPSEVLALDDPASGVRVLGYVADLTAIYNDVRINLAPLRVGAGMKGKVVAGLSAGLPTLGSSVALEGMGLEDGKDVIMADEPSEFARNFALLDSDDALWTRLSNAGVATARREFSVEAASARLESILQHLGLPSRLRSA